MGHLAGCTSVLIPMEPPIHGKLWRRLQMGRDRLTMLLVEVVSFSLSFHGLWQLNHCSIDANYPTADTHAYSPVPIFGPKDSTSKGFFWDPLKNWVASNADTSTNFHPLPNEVSSLPGYNQSITGDDVWAMLAYEGRWGNSFSQLKQAKIFATFSVPGLSGLKVCILFFI